jgi:hypothetical protein
MAMECHSDISFSPTLAHIPTTEDVAKWMLEQIEKHRVLYKDDAVTRIAKTFGEAFTYENENGNAAIRRDVL